MTAMSRITPILLLNLSNHKCTVLEIKTDNQLNLQKKKIHRVKGIRYIWIIVNNKHGLHSVNTGITDGYHIPVIINNRAQLYTTVIDK